MNGGIFEVTRHDVDFFPPNSIFWAFDHVAIRLQRHNSWAYYKQANKLEFTESIKGRISSFNGPQAITDGTHTLLDNLEYTICFRQIAGMN